MSNSPYYANYPSQPQELDLWEQDSQYVPTLGYTHSPYATRSDCSRSLSTPLDDEPSPASGLRPDFLPLLQEPEREKDKIYDEDHPSCIHYFIEWRVTVNKKVIVKDTEEDLVLAPSAYWELILEKKLQTVLREKVSRNKRVRVDDSDCCDGQRSFPARLD